MSEVWGLAEKYVKVVQTCVKTVEQRGVKLETQRCVSN